MKKANLFSSMQEIDAIEDVLKRKEISYYFDSNEQTFTFQIEGNDIPMPFEILVDEEEGVVNVESELPFICPKKKRSDMAIAVCYATNGLLYGDFEFDIESGKLYYHTRWSFDEGIIAESVLEFIFSISKYVVDLFNDKFYALIKDTMSLEEFCEIKK